MNSFTTEKLEKLFQIYHKSVTKEKNVFETVNVLSIKVGDDLFSIILEEDDETNKAVTSVIAYFRAPYGEPNYNVLCLNGEVLNGGPWEEKLSALIESEIRDHKIKVGKGYFDRIVDNAVFNEEIMPEE